MKKKYRIIKKLRLIDDKFITMYYVQYLSWDFMIPSWDTPDHIEPRGYGSVENAMNALDLLKEFKSINYNKVLYTTKF